MTQMIAWIPIEESHKDGTRWILYRKEDDYEHVQIGWFDPEQGEWLCWDDENPPTHCLPRPATPGTGGF